MIGTAHILAILRLRRLSIGMLLVPMLVLNLLATSLGTGHVARATTFDDVVARSRCLTGSETMLPDKAPAKPGKHQPCPACATACTTGCCAGPALVDGNVSVNAPPRAASLDAAWIPSPYLIVLAQFRFSQPAQAPPRRQASQSFDA